MALEAVADVELLLEVPAQGQVQNGRRVAASSRVAATSAASPSPPSTSALGSPSSRRPGELLVSSTVRDLVVGSDLRFADRGEHELRGLPGRWHVLAARD